MNGLVRELHSEEIRGRQRQKQTKKKLISCIGQGRKSWQWAEHMWLYSDLLQALRENICQLWVLSVGDLNFCVHSSPLWDPSKGSEFQ